MGINRSVTGDPKIQNSLLVLFSLNHGQVVTLPRLNKLEHSPNPDVVKCVGHVALTFASLSTSTTDIVHLLPTPIHHVDLLVRFESFITGSPLPSLLFIYMFSNLLSTRVKVRSLSSERWGTGERSREGERSNLSIINHAVKLSLTLKAK